MTLDRYFNSYSKCQWEMTLTLIMVCNLLTISWETRKILDKANNNNLHQLLKWVMIMISLKTSKTVQGKKANKSLAVRMTAILESRKEITMSSNKKLIGPVLRLPSLIWIMIHYCQTNGRFIWEVITGKRNSSET